MPSSGWLSCVLNPRSETRLMSPGFEHSNLSDGPHHGLDLARYVRASWYTESIQLTTRAARPAPVSDGPCAAEVHEHGHPTQIPKWQG